MPTYMMALYQSASSGYLILCNTCTYTIRVHNDRVLLVYYIIIIYN